MGLSPTVPDKSTTRRILKHWLLQLWGITITCSKETYRQEDLVQTLGQPTSVLTQRLRIYTLLYKIYVDEIINLLLHVEMDEMRIEMPTDAVVMEKTNCDYNSRKQKNHLWLWEQLYWQKVTSAWPENMDWWICSEWNKDFTWKMYIVETRNKFIGLLTQIEWR